MDLHPILDCETDLKEVKKDIWYVLACTGEAPTPRVGHTFVFNPTGHKVYCVGGATPDGIFADTFVLDLNTLQWVKLLVPGLIGRYEHTALLLSNQHGKVLIFGGANQIGNMNDIQMFDAITGTWEIVKVSGKPPAPRTQHTNAVICDDKLVVYSGGRVGADPIGDKQVHIYDASTCSWSSPSFAGSSPKPRQGHVMIAVNNQVYIHGGMSGTTFYDDLHVLDFEEKRWRQIAQDSEKPIPRAAHCGVLHRDTIYIFGGLSKNGALNDMHSLDLESLKWTAMKFHTPPPAPRLDFSMCVIEINHLSFLKKSNSSSQLQCNSASQLEERFVDLNIIENLTTSVSDTPAGHSENSTMQQEEKELSDNTTLEDCQDQDISSAFILIHGGMDTEGEIYGDCMLLKL